MKTSGKPLEEIRLLAHLLTLGVPLLWIPVWPIAAVLYLLLGLYITLTDKK